ncbi:MAG: hypothetical protein BKP49_06530 [Treponema sp. CETP13]|nr:MAG: hypothetical protein BKP49_06530 [Treponema sp. CETP13]
MRKLPTKLFTELYGDDKKEIERQKNRYSQLVSEFAKRYTVPADDSSIRLFSSPGRTEICGNHTDHNFGKVIGASIQLDCIGAVQPTNDTIVTIHDLTYNEDYSIDTLDTERRLDESGSQALVRGIIQGFKKAGYKVTGFNSCFSSEVIAAAGVSSSASFEMIICIIIDALFNGNTIPVTQFAAIGQYSENKYWDKASGQLDQMSCAVGGMIHIDFENPTKPLVTKVPFDFAKENYNLMLVNTGKGHADLSAEYSSIPDEMKSVAKEFGKSTLRGLEYTDIFAKLPELRTKCGDRAVLRSLHFIEESNRSDHVATALKTNDFAQFLQLITDSGNSSWKWLQNISVPGYPEEQPIAICLALTEVFIRSKKHGACRVHGGGFAGVIAAFLPKDYVAEYTSYMEKALDWKEGSTKHNPVYKLSIRPYGCIEIK